MYKITRKAVLIGSPGSIRDNGYLHGVEHDLNNVKEFLLSESGGCFYDNEIITLFDCTSSMVNSVIKNVYCDYLFVYFSGHGYNDDNKNKLCLKDGNISDFQLLNNSPRQLVIVDACRSFIHTGLGAIPGFESWSSFDGERSLVRKIFDNFIKRSPIGKMIVHSTKKGEVSYDTPDGGIFTNALLKSCYNFKPTSSYLPLSIKSMVKQASQELGGKQNPCIYYSGELLVPLGIGIPFVQKKTIQNLPQRVQIPITATEAIVGSLAISLLVFGLFSLE